MNQEERLKLPLNERYVGVIFEGSTFPDAPYKSNLKIVLNDNIINEYIPARDFALQGDPLGLKLLVTIQAYQEGFRGRVVNKKRIGTKSWLTNNPGNIGNTDSGATQRFPSLPEGVLAQKGLIDRIIAGKSPRYPMGKLVEIPPFFSKEIANHPEYGLPYNLPGYKFIFTGQLDQYVKIYATGARAGNGYINRIVSFFRQNGIIIKPSDKIQDIIKIK